MKSIVRLFPGEMRWERKEKKAERETKRFGIKEGHCHHMFGAQVSFVSLQFGLRAYWANTFYLKEASLFSYIILF